MDMRNGAMQARRSLLKHALLGFASMPFASWPLRAQGPRQAITVGDVLRGRFVQERHLKGFARPLRSEGSFVLAPGRGLIWRTETPFPVTTVITAQGLVQEVDGRETLRMPAARLPFLARLYDMFTGSLAGDWRVLENQFAVQRSGDDRAWTVNLAPRPGTDPTTMPVRAVELKGSTYVDTVRIDKPDGDHDRLTFLGQSLSRGPLSAAETALLAQAQR
jgi:hypothetical protein